VTGATDTSAGDPSAAATTADTGEPVTGATDTSAGDPSAAAKSVDTSTLPREATATNEDDNMPLSPPRTPISHAVGHYETLPVINRFPCGAWGIRRPAWPACRAGTPAAGGVRPSR